MGLTLNGIAAPLGADDVSCSIETIGEQARSASGKALSTVRRRFRKYSGKLLIADAALAEAWRGLIAGDGIGWSFDTDLYSDGTGLGPDSGYTASVVASDGGVTPKFGTKFLKVPATTSIVWTHGLALARWSAAVWTYESGAWHHYFWRADTHGSQHYKNGVLVSSAKPSWSTCTANSIALSGNAGSVRHFDDLVMLEFLAPVGWAASIYGYGAAWPKPPLLAGGGSLVAYGSTVLRGRIETTDLANRGSLDALETIAFSLEED